MFVREEVRERDLRVVCVNVSCVHIHESTHSQSIDIMISTIPRAREPSFY